MPEPTKADLKAAVTRLTEENGMLREHLAALFDVCTAAHDAAGKGKHPNFILGYLGQVGEHPDVTLSCLRTYAARLREVPADLLAPVITGTGRTCPCCTDDPLHSGDCNCREDCGVTQCQAAEPDPGDAPDYDEDCDDCRTVRAAASVTA